MTGDEDRDIPISFRFSVFPGPPLAPSRWEGKKYRLSNNLFPLPTGGGEGVGDPIAGGQSNSDPLCSNTDILYAMSIARGFRGGPPVLPAGWNLLLARAEAARTPVSKVGTMLRISTVPSKPASEMSLRSPRVRRTLGLELPTLGSSPTV